MFAWIAAAHQLGAGAAATLAGFIRTATLSYDAAFVSSGVLCIFAASIVLFIGRRPAALRTVAAG
jgi:hypothetical protein